MTSHVFLLEGLLLYNASRLGERENERGLHQYLYIQVVNARYDTRMCVCVRMSHGACERAHVYAQRAFKHMSSGV